MMFGKFALGTIAGTASVMAITFGSITGLAIKESREIPECSAPVVIQRDTQ